MVMGARTEKADKEEQMKLAWLANNSYGPVSFVSSDLQVFHIKSSKIYSCLFVSSTNLLASVRLPKVYWKFAKLKIH